MATKLSSLRMFEIKRYGYCEVSEYIWCGGKTHLIIKKPRKVIKLPVHSFPKINRYGRTFRNISRKHKVELLLKDKILPSVYIYKHIKGLVESGVNILISEIAFYNSPVNTRAIVIRHVLAKFYERRDLINSLNSRANLTNKVQKTKV